MCIAISLGGILLLAIGLVISHNRVCRDCVLKIQNFKSPREEGANPLKDRAQQAHRARDAVTIAVEAVYLKQLSVKQR